MFHRTLFNTGFGVVCRSSNSQQKVDNHPDLNISANYHRLRNIKKNIVQAVKEQNKNEMVSSCHQHYKGINLFIF